MTDTSAAARCRIWRDHRVVHDGPPPPDLVDVVHDPSCLVWLDLVGPTPQRMAALGEALDLSAAALEDAVAPLERPKVVRHDHHLFFQTYATSLGTDPPAAVGEQGRLVTERLSGFVLAHALVTVRTGCDPVIAEAVRRWDEDLESIEVDAGLLVHGLLDVVVDGHFETIQRLDDDIEAMEDELFAEQRTGRAFTRTVYGLRKDLVKLRRVVLPMREVVNGLLRHRRTRDGDLAMRYDDLYDHVLRAAEWTESLRDMVTTVFETNLSLTDSHLNVVMRQLAAWAAIIAVPTAITGWFGQNVPYLGFGQTWGVWLSVGLIVTASVALYMAFRRRDWL